MESKNKIFDRKNISKFYNWTEMAKINKLEEDVNDLKNLKNLFINFVQQYEINNQKIFDKLKIINN